MFRKSVARGHGFGKVLRALSFGAIACFGLASIGCSSTNDSVSEQRSTGGATPQTFRNATLASVFDAGAEAMRENFTVVRVSQGRGTVEAGPESFTQRGGTARVTDSALKPTYQMRRIGTLWISDDGDGVVVNCQIRMQRLDTTDYRSQQTHMQFNDLPTDTPIDNEAGLTADQREAWTEQPRDQTMERQILGAISRRLHGESPIGASQ